MWLARDKDNNLYLYKELPVREEEGFSPYSDVFEYLKLDNNLFPDVKWEDEPQEVMLVKVE